MPSPVDLAIKTDVPLLLFPVRLETRFRGTELLIRIYPDAVQIDSFERRLSDAEIQWGKHFWQQTQLANTEDEQRNAWAQLVQIFGAQRAAWIATQISTNKAEKLDDPKTAQMPCAQLLPDKWVAIGYRYDNAQSAGVQELFRTDGHAILERLPVIPPFDNALSREDLTSPPTVEWLKKPDGSWLFNFEKAEAIGMGLRVPNPPASIDLLLVYGIKTSLDQDSAENPLEDLLQAHHYTQGLAFVSQGTPTNNTTSAQSGYNSEDIDSFEIERQQTAVTDPDSQQNYAVMAKALGINPTILVNVQDATVQEQLAAKEMNQTLWQSTWGDFLEKMLELANSHRTGIDAMKQHFVDYVRARGPLPALRIGTQPYGVLPVMALGQAGDDMVKTGPAVCLRALREIWREALKNEDLVPRLKRGDDNSLTLLQVLAMTPTGIDYVGRNCTRIVAASSPTSDEGWEKTGRIPLPPKLQAALDAMPRDSTVTPPQQTVTPHQRTVFTSPSGLFLVRSPLDGDGGFGENGHKFLFNLLRDTKIASGDLGEFPEAARELLLSETLDLCSHRLDAWITSLATKRLLGKGELRQKKPAGITIGGYGWVENLEPDQGNKNTENDDPDAYIHAPSLAHATTAAILRSGYLSRRASQNTIDSNALAVNLSSHRIRLALHLVDGVRGGQSLGTLLGYRFERALHEQGWDEDIPAFRTIAPGSTELVSPGEVNDQTKAKLNHLVLDGLELLQAYKHDLDEPDPTKKEIPPDLFKKCEPELKRLGEALDAVADLVLAESVHHVAQGNPVRAGATLEAITCGEAPPPEVEFVRTPRTGINHTHRISVVFEEPLATFPWGITTPRAQAEPILNAWVAQLLGPQAEEATCIGSYTDTSGAHALPLSLKMLGLAPLDLVYMLDGELGANDSEIEQRIVAYLQTQTPSAKSISLEFASSTGGAPAQLAEVLEVARTIRRLITGARALEPRDIVLPEQAVVNAALPVDQTLIDRATAARASFIHATKTLSDLLPKEPDVPLGNPPAVRKSLNELASYGLTGAIPIIPPHLIEKPDTAFKQLHVQARAVLSGAQTRQARAQAIATSIQTTAQAVSLLKAIFGDDFQVLPSFTPNTNNGEELNQTFAKSTAWQGGDPLASITWFQRITRVRDGAARLDAVMLYAEALNGPLLSFQVGQLPDVKDERWVALENPPPGNRLSLVCLTTVTDFTKPLAGLMVEEWVESVPNREEVTGLTFHYDAPQPRAPQALLLALAPEGVNQWNSTLLEQTLRETLELAKLRAVDLTALGEVGQYLPAMYVDSGKFPVEVRSYLSKGDS